MSSAFGQYLKLSIFGQSHGEALGVTLDGFPAGMTIDMEQLLAEMARRAPGQSLMTTARKEPDAPEFLSGVLNGRTTGQPICAIIRNTNQRSKDYGDGVDLVRPGHADYTGHVRYFGFEDWRGGGSFSGKDPTKVDRSAAYAARYVAKNIVAAGLAKKCEIQIAYAIGVAHPVSVMIDTFGTGIISDDTLSEIGTETFDLRPAAIIDSLDLRRPIYRQLAAYGHMGRTDLDLPWEKTDKAVELKQAAGI